MGRRHYLGEGRVRDAVIAMRTTSEVKESVRYLALREGLTLAALLEKALLEYMSKR